MKLLKVEKIWLIAVGVFYLLYNIPGLPPYNMAVPTLVHALLTVVPLWILVYVGLARVYRAYRLRDISHEDTSYSDQELSDPSKKL